MPRLRHERFTQGPPDPLEEVKSHFRNQMLQDEDFCDILRQKILASPLPKGYKMADYTHIRIEPLPWTEVGVNRGNMNNGVRVTLYNPEMPLVKTPWRDLMLVSSEGKPLHGLTDQTIDTFHRASEIYDRRCHDAIALLRPTELPQSDVA